MTCDRIPRRSERISGPTLGALPLALALMVTPGSAGDIHRAALVGDLAEVRNHLAKDSAHINVKDKDGDTPLHVASWAGHHHVVGSLLEHGTSIEAENDAGYRPLHSAILGRRESIVALLLAQGADVDAITGAGETPLLIALSARGTPAIAKVLLRHGADVNIPNAGGMTPLYKASLGGPVELVEQLLARGAEIDAKAFGTTTALFAATIEGNAAAVEVLAKRGADVNVTEQGRTPLIVAAMMGYDGIAEHLLNAGAEVNSADAHFGRTPLQWAAIRGSRRIVALLVRQGADLTVKDANGCDPCRLASRYAHGDVVELLESRGACGQSGGSGTSGPLPITEHVARGEGVFWYLGHCGWAVKTQRHLLVFDYWNTGKDPAAPSLANGHINPEEIRDEKVLVFVTHEHHDHYDPVILNWPGKIRDLTYVFGFRPERLVEHGSVRYAGPAYEYVGPRQKKRLGDVEVLTIEANDAGVGFLVKVDGLTVYHAGDHAGWAPGQRGGFVREIDYLATRADRVDVAFVNVTGCHAHGTGPLREGTLYTVDKLSPHVVAPTHAGDREFIYLEASRVVADEGLTLPLVFPASRGDGFKYSRGEIRKW